MEAIVYRHRQYDISLLTINITKWGTKNKVVENTYQRPEIPYFHSGIFLETINTACRWSKRSAKRNILSIARVITSEATPKFWGMEDWRKWCKERKCWTRIEDFTVGVDVVDRCYFSINFCASHPSCCCIIVAIYPSLLIIFDFSSILCTLSSSSHWIAKARWASLGEVIYHFSEHICCDLFSTVSFKNMSSLCCINATRVALLSVAVLKPLLIDGLLRVCLLSGEISRCAIGLVDGWMMRNVNVNVD